MTVKNPSCERCGEPIDKKKGYTHWMAYSHIDCDLDVVAAGGRDKPAWDPADWESRRARETSETMNIVASSKSNERKNEED